MEAILTKDLWIWHAFISRFIRFLGFLNNINVVDHSAFMVNYLHGIATHVEFIVYGLTYYMCYLLANGIYMNWAISRRISFNHKWEAKMVCKNVKNGSQKYWMHIWCSTIMRGRGANVATKWNNHEIDLENNCDHAQYGCWWWRRGCRIQFNFLTILDFNSSRGIPSANTIIIQKICSCEN
jgi:hypothetical protein